jgi:hypothetical protein
MSCARKRATRTSDGSPTLHNDGTVSWQAAGDWRRTDPGDIPPLVLVHMTPGYVRNLLINKYQEARGM